MKPFNNFNHKKVDFCITVFLFQSLQFVMVVRGYLATERCILYNMLHYVLSFIITRGRVISAGKLTVR